ncbi:MAG: hypothetical protein ACREVW_13815, partial [Burkholderiales bacterium]
MQRVMRCRAVVPLLLALISACSDTPPPAPPAPKAATTPASANPRAAAITAKTLTVDANRIIDADKE